MVNHINVEPSNTFHESQTAQVGIRELIKNSIDFSNSRLEFWAHFLPSIGCESMAEIGVWKGDFAKETLQNCSSIKKYYMIDPWRHLEGWNKPINISDSLFEKHFQEAMEKTSFAKDKITMLRGTTTEVIDNIDDNSLDFVYIDGDHTLKGITIDLIRSYSKLKHGGFIGGDDFYPSIWQHSMKSEPTLVFPFAIYFAEAMGAEIWMLRHKQFLIRRPSSLGQHFSAVDFTGCYNDRGLLTQLSPTDARRGAAGVSPPQRDHREGNPC